MKIIMIGSVSPYKGGIAHYTSLMARALLKRHDTTMLSYSLQYPKLLFKRGQKDYENKSFQIDPTHYIINTVNPVTYFKTARFIKNKEPDLVIVQWWHLFFAPAYWSILSLLHKRCKILFLCHNVFPHEKFPLQKMLTRMVLGKGDVYVVHSGLDESDLLRTRKRSIEGRYILHIMLSVLQAPKKQKQEVSLICPSASVFCCF